ncbi:hypothetical protein [Streptomyces axinellae]|uniref:Uncharacterized protein n=1 Tax=Streptomyces axinellae TaxID=552788 RepID=A0ABP6CDY7_9ACTN
MRTDGSAPARAPFLQTPESLIDNVGISPTALRLLQALAKLPPRNARNSDAVARSLRMGKDRTNAARKILREQGHWHARKRQNVRGEIRDQRLASLTPLRTADEIAAGWAAAEEAVRLGKDTADSRRLGVRIPNSREWLAPRAGRAPAGVGAPAGVSGARVCASGRGGALGVEPAAGSAAARPTRRRPQEGDQTEETRHTPLPAPVPVPVSVPAPALDPVSASALDPGTAPALGPSAPSGMRGPGTLTGPLAVYAVRAEHVLMRLRRTAPALVLSSPQARELAQIAGHYLLRGEGPETLRAVLVHGLPPEGVRCPHAFVRQRLLRYLPPVPDWPQPASASASLSSAPSEPPCPHPASPDRPDGPVSRIRRGEGWRAVLRYAADEAPPARA